MKPLNFRIENESEIILPGNIADAKLTLAEIGAIACFVAIETGLSDFTSSRFTDDDMIIAIKSLKEKGVLNVSVAGNQVNISLDLEKVT